MDRNNHLGLQPNLSGHLCTDIHRWVHLDPQLSDSELDGHDRSSRSRNHRGILGEDEVASEVEGQCAFAGAQYCWVLAMFEVGLLWAGASRVRQDGEA